MTTPANQTLDTITASDKTERRNRDQEVIDAAITVMASRGYAATSVQEIADRVGVLKGSLYHYFSSKEELLYRIILESHEQSQRIAAETSALNLSPLEELSEFLLRSARWFIENTERAKIFFLESKHLTNERRSHVREAGRTYWNHLFTLVEAGQKSGEIDTDTDALLHTEYILGAINSIVDWPRRAKGHYSTVEMAETFVKLTRRTLAVSQ